MVGFDDEFIHRQEEEEISRAREAAGQLRAKGPELVRKYGKDVALVTLYLVSADKEEERMGELALNGLKPGDQAKVQEARQEVDAVASIIRQFRQGYPAVAL